MTVPRWLTLTYWILLAALYSLAGYALVLMYIILTQ